MKILQIPALFSGIASYALGQTNPSPTWTFDPPSGIPSKLFWKSEPFKRYNLLESVDLVRWTQAASFPKIADSTVMDYSISPAAEKSRFFKIVPIDDQPPNVIDYFPMYFNFGVGRFSQIRVELRDSNEIDISSIRLRLGEHDELTIGSGNLEIRDGILTYDPADSPLGDWDETIQVRLHVADKLGNFADYYWSFTLEPEPIIADNIFVFGSDSARQSGQIVSSPITHSSPKLERAPIKSESQQPKWTLESVEADRITISCEDTPPALPIDTLICNATPKNFTEVFYRKVTASTFDQSGKSLVLMTQNISVEEFIIQGAIRTNEGSIVYESNDGGLILGAKAKSSEWNLGSIGPDLSGRTIWQSGGARLHLKQAQWQLTPKITTAVEIKEGRVQRFESGVRGEIRSAIIPEFSYSNSIEFSQSEQLASARRLVFLGFVGIVPLWLDIDFELGADFRSKVGASFTASGGVRQDINLDFGCNYSRGRTPEVTWTKGSSSNQSIVPFTYAINGQAEAEIKITPKLDLRLNSLVGVEAKISPTFGFSGEATVTDGVLESAEWAVYSKSNLDLGLSIVGVNSDNLPSTSLNFYSYNWVEIFPEVLNIRSYKGEVLNDLLGYGFDPYLRQNVSAKDHAEDWYVMAGNKIRLEVVATGPGGNDNLQYQWYHLARPLLGETKSTLDIEGGEVVFYEESDIPPHYNRIGGGSYYCRVSSKKRSNGSPENPEFLDTQKINIYYVGL